MNDNSWSKLSAGLFALLLALVIYVWLTHIAEFREVRADVKVLLHKVETLVEAK